LKSLCEEATSFYEKLSMENPALRIFSREIEDHRKMATPYFSSSGVASHR
jgi:hypothetical protein